MYTFWPVANVETQPVALMISGASATGIIPADMLVTPGAAYIVIQLIDTSASAQIVSAMIPINIIGTQPQTQRESNAAASASQAAAAANSAATSANNAAAAANNAADNANAAVENANAAAANARLAATSARNAGLEALNAKTQALNAAESATQAAETANSAATSATNAATSATNAATSANNAAAAANNAADNANAAVENANAAAANARLAATSARNAGLEALNAKTQALNAAESATQAAETANSAATSATNAATSATNAATSATNAATSATNAATSANSAANAANSAAENASQVVIDAATTGISYNQTNDIVTFETDAGYPLQITSMIDVTQEGSGTPSADNVRAFVPWTNATLDVAGVNLISWAVPGKTFNGNGMTGEIDADGAVINGTPTNNYAQLNYQSALLRPGTYTPNGGEANKFYFNLYLFETLGGSAIGTSNHGGKVVTLDEPTNVQIKMQASTVANTGTLENYRLAPMLTLADQALADGEFVPYIGQKYTQALGQSVYGGSYNWATGELTITAAHIASYNGEALPGMWRCDRADYAPGTTPPTGSAVVYALATPQIVQVGTPQTIQTIAGINNVWSSTGQTNVIGFTKVLSVNNIMPDANGNVTITPQNIPGLEAYIQSIIAAQTASTPTTGETSTATAEAPTEGTEAEGGTA